MYVYEPKEAYIAPQMPKAHLVPNGARPNAGGCLRNDNMPEINIVSGLRRTAFVQSFSRVVLMLAYATTHQPGPCDE